MHPYFIFTIYNSQDREATKVAINTWMDKDHIYTYTHTHTHTHTYMYLYSEILLLHKKELYLFSLQQHGSTQRELH